ncbi:glucosamine-6-phosphate deaminase [Mycetocola sp.]|uniref:glucosamine-6-phosphate deaminase n=1 Tax=Mycetocola sp. TaxID=1871042 RepID=UPI003989C299
MVADTSEVGAVAESAVWELLRSNPEAVLGVATGSTPGPLYQALASRGKKFPTVQAFALDEYCGIDASDPNSYRSTLLREFARPLGIPAEHVHVPSTSNDCKDNAADYESSISEAGGIAVQILGVGTNGHIAFNEPGSSFESRTRVVELTERTRRDNSRYFPSISDVPRSALTQGIGTILEARKLVVMAFGVGKAAAVAAALEGPVTTDVPASAIQTHPDVIVCLDLAAASSLTRSHR